MCTFFFVTLANILITWLLPVDFIGVGSSIEIVLHSNLACRLVVGLREAGRLSGLCKSQALELTELTNNTTAVFAHTNPSIVSSNDAWRDPEVREGPSAV